MKKTTFGTSNKKVAVKEGIKMFQDLSKGEECMIGSGRCSRHNVRNQDEAYMEVWRDWAVKCMKRSGRFS